MNITLNMKYKNHLWQALLFSISVLILSGCYGDDEIEFTPFQATFESLDQFALEYGKKDTLPLAISQDGHLIEYKNLLIHVPSDGLVDEKDNVVNDPTSVVISSFSDNGDMILNNLPSSAIDEEELVMYQSMYIDFYRNDEKLEVMNSSALSVYSYQDEPFADIDKLYVFKQSDIEDFEGWDPNSLFYDSIKHTTWAFEFEEELYSGNGYNFSCKEGWYGIGGYFYEVYEDYTYTPITLQLNEEYIYEGQQYTVVEPYLPENTTIYVSMDNHPCVFTANYSDGQWKFPKVLDNEPFTLVVLSEQEETLFFNKYKGEMNDGGLHIKLTPIPYSITYILEEINAI